MSRFLCKIIDTFWLETIGLTVATDAKSADVRLSVGEAIELLRPDGSRLETEVAAIPRVRPRNPDQSFDFLLPRSVRKSDVPVGTEVWITK